MLKFDIVTYCSKNYEDTLRFTIDSWVKNCNSERIYIYTDSLGDPSISKKIIFKPMFEDSNDYELNIGRKLLALRHYYENYASDHFVLLDVDNYVVEDFSEVFEGDHEVGVTRLLDRWRGKKKTVTVGNVFFNNSPHLKVLLDRWLEEQQAFFKAGKGVNIPKSGITYAQRSFDRLIRKDWKGKNSFKIKPLPREVYNSEENTLKLWLKTIRKVRPKILHYKGERWKQKEYRKGIEHELKNRNN